MSNQIKRQLSFTTYEAYKKIKDDDAIKILFESIDWSFLPSLLKDIYPEGRELVYTPVALFKSQLLIWLGEVDSNRQLAKALRFNSRLCVLCGFDNFLKTPAHSTFSYFRKKIGKERYFRILHRLIAQVATLTADGRVNINSSILHIVIYSNDGKSICNCNAHRCKYQLKKKKSSRKNKTFVKHFVANSYKVKMTIDSVFQLPTEVILSPKEKKSPIQ